MEGAVWMGKKLSNEIEKVCQSFEFLLMEYNRRLAQSQDSTRASAWLIEAVKQAGFDLYEKTITILESAIFHMEDAAQNRASQDQAAKTQDGSGQQPLPATLFGRAVDTQQLQRQLDQILTDK